MRHWISATALLAGLAVLPNTVTAQLTPFAPTEAMDTLNSAPVGGGLNPNAFVGRAQAAAGGGGALPGAAGGSPFGAPAPGASPFGAPAPGASPFGAPPAGGSPFGAPAGATPLGAPVIQAPTGGDPFANASTPFDDPALGGNFGAPQQPQIVLPALPTWERVLGGERVTCAVTGRILSDASWIYVWSTDAQQNYFDDGTHGDPVANDQYRSHITTRNNEVAPIVWTVFRQTKQMIRTAEAKDPLSFFGLPALTTDPGSKLAKLIDKERDRDTRVREWNDKFLREFRVNPDDEKSEFYAPFIPAPPIPPDVPAPAGFRPPGRGAFQAGQKAEGGFDQFLNTGGGLNATDPLQDLGGLGAQRPDVTGVPLNSAASSNYFSTTAVGGGGSGK